MLFEIFRYAETLPNYQIAGMVIATALMILFALPFHEAAHGLVAYKLGDYTAKYQGRLSLNPIHHLDPIGTLMLALFGFGWAKPVQINVLHFKNRKRDMALTAAAGPISNLLLALISLFFSNLFYYCFPLSAVVNNKILFYIQMIGYCTFVSFASINIGLAVFNLIPFPPLDGSRILGLLVKDRYYYQIMQYERYLMLLLIVLMATGALSHTVGTISGWIMSGFDWLVSLPFRAIFG